MVRIKSNQAVRSGKIVKMPCWICGSPHSEIHHEDYDKPFEIVWLCKGHHKDIHKFKEDEYTGN